MTTSTRQRRKLGSTGPEVFPIALGCMGMSGMYGATDEAESLATFVFRLVPGPRVREARAPLPPGLRLPAD